MHEDHHLSIGICNENKEHLLNVQNVHTKGRKQEQLKLLIEKLNTENQKLTKNEAHKSKCKKQSTGAKIRNFCFYIL